METKKKTTATRKELLKFVVKHNKWWFTTSHARWKQKEEIMAPLQS